MARIRTIKPEFFLHEELTELSPLHRLLFIGLWCLADKKGRLEDRPKRIKVEILPWDDADVNAMLDDLQTGGFILRYEAEGLKLIQVIAFEKHQRITGKEREQGKVLPQPPGIDYEEAPEKQLDADISTVEKQEGIIGEAPGKHPRKTREAPGKHPGAQERSTEYGVLRSSPPTPPSSDASLPGFDEEDEVRLKQVVKVLDLAEFILKVERAIIQAHGETVACEWMSMLSRKKADWLIAAWEMAANARVKTPYIAKVIGTALVEGTDLTSPGAQESCAPPAVAPPPVDPQIVRERYSRQLAPLLLRAGMTRPEAEAFLRDSPLEALEARLAELTGPPPIGGSRGAA